MQMILINAQPGRLDSLRPMDKLPDICELIEADARLQREINHALEAAIDHLLPAAGGGRAMIHLLTRTLLPSWQCHCSLQSEVIFPIAEARQDSAVLPAITRLRANYPELAHHHATAGNALLRLLGLSKSPEQGDLSGMRQQLCAALKARQAHFRLSAQLDAPPSGTLTPAEQALCTLWLATRPQPCFPLNMLLAERVAHQELMGGPSAGLRLH
ncbi:hypothetical protein [Hyphomicrobium sulfonivorans]|uniref:hypothetical protein n=1 Tax=Hyphomicrobium sulfonivorans TaxID=121290 RepID=UPI000837FFD9|nr:hypothetical protein [Hyphomicrobium sulfonivorans]